MNGDRACAGCGEPIELGHGFQARNGLWHYGCARDAGAQVFPGVSAAALELLDERRSLAGEIDRPLDDFDPDDDPELLELAAEYGAIGGDEPAREFEEDDKDDDDQGELELELDDEDDDQEGELWPE